MTEHLWLVYAVLSAVMAALVSIFGKIGLQGLDADTATVIRAVIMALFLIAVMAVQRNFGHVGEILADRRALTFIILSGTAGAMSWLFYFAALKYGRVSKWRRWTNSAWLLPRLPPSCFWERACRCFPLPGLP